MSQDASASEMTNSNSREFRERTVTIFDDENSELFICRSSECIASSAADKSCGFASGDGADWRSA